ncbi:hypothetical protein F5B22DRAFT_103833 [Xylaria bambusicola]|uniref:uncharacterized protein n=1 Tax=Xylaria bambusicola TaxID=326684 RepID=UPI0020075175|nr:uncharacterized protein F5B22DRAFT_103833 [Xylaria bambusicola]KAI0517889.1 hypothetical protein F5B22DRAFT_103833 [Xylaria bambusicola]
MLGLCELESAALDVISILKGLPQFAEQKIAVIGGTALWKYLPRGRSTEDVDFIVTLDGPKSIKPILLKLKNSPFEERAQWFYYRTPATKLIQIDFVAQWQAPYFPSAAQKIKDIPRGIVPMISPEDLVLSKMFSCGLRANPRQKRRDAGDAEDLLEALTAKVPSLRLSDAKIEVAKQGLADVLSVSERGEAWWRSKLGIPKSPSPSPSRVVSSASSASRGGSSGQRGSPRESASKGSPRRYY